MNKKRIILAAMMVFAVISLSEAQNFYPALKKYSASGKEQLDKAYAECLTIRNNGLIESALAIVTLVKLDVPADEFPKIKSEIDDLMAYGPTPVIRYKAYLAAAVFTDPKIFREESFRSYNDPEDIFKALADRMSKTLLSSN